jgi:hypothetical protein
VKVMTTPGPKTRRQTLLECPEGHLNLTLDARRDPKIAASSMPKEFRLECARTWRSAACPEDGVFGIDFRHAVEFSRSGRAPVSTLAGLLRGNPSTLRALARPGQTGPSGRPRRLRSLRTGWSWGSAETDRSSLRSFLPSSEEELTRV